MESRRLRMQATPRGGNTTPRRRLPAFVVEFNKAIVLLLLLLLLLSHSGLPPEASGTLRYMLSYDIRR